MKKFLLYSAIFVLVSGAPALSQQKTWTLDECINHAIDNNLQIKKQGLQTDIKKNSLVQSKIKLLPSLNASATENVTWGRNPDPTTYEFVEQRMMSNNFGISGGTDIFNGLQNYNTIKRNQYDLLSSEQDLQNAKEDLLLKVAVNYLQILLQKELVLVNTEQLEITKQQIEKTSKLVEAGSKALSELLLIESQAAQEELQLINMQNLLDIYYLDITQLLELPTPEGFDVAIPKINIDANAIIGETVEDIFLVASGMRPGVKSSELSLTASQYDLKIARGMRSPRLSMSHFISTGYSDASKNYSFINQVKDKRSYGFGFSLNIPIFNGWQVNKTISNSKISVDNAQYTLDETKKQLYKNIQKAYTDALAALKKFAASEKAVIASEESFRHSEQRFEVGLVTPVEYNESKNKLLKAQSELAQAKYEYVFKTKMLDFYKGIPLSLN